MLLRYKSAHSLCNVTPGALALAPCSDSMCSLKALGTCGFEPPTAFRKWRGLLHIRRHYFLCFSALFFPKASHGLFAAFDRNNRLLCIQSPKNCSSSDQNDFLTSQGLKGELEWFFPLLSGPEFLGDKDKSRKIGKCRSNSVEYCHALFLP